MSKTLRLRLILVPLVITIIGLGGLASSLAAKDASANTIAGIYIIVDKPFTIGDWVSNDIHQQEISMAYPRTGVYMESLPDESKGHYIKSFDMIQNKDITTEY